MHIVMVASEFAPLAKVGGLADVVGGLSNELARQGHQVDVIIPRYKSLSLDPVLAWQQRIDRLTVPFFDRTVDARVFETQLRGCPATLRIFALEPIEESHLFDRDQLYGYPDDGTRFAWLSRAAMELIALWDQPPDIIHCHDWQTGLVPVLLYEAFQAQLARTRAVITLHNLHHQGVMGDDILHQVHLDPRRLKTPDRLLHPHGELNNLLKGGIVYANAITTVSRTYAHEIRTTEHGCGLQHTLNIHRDKLRGILNGIDTTVWNPSHDPVLSHPYSADAIEGKYENKRVLRERLGLADRFAPIVAVISRLDAQKGCHLMHHALRSSLGHNAQFALLGVAPDPRIGDEFRRLQDDIADHPDAHIELAFDDELAHLMYAGAEILVVPSRFEPCGLTQMIALAYGTVPVVRRTGGLGETVFDANHSGKPFDEVNGFTFDDDNEAGLDSALLRAIGLWHKHPEYFRKLQLNGIRTDRSWARPAREYIEIYTSLTSDS